MTTIWPRPNCQLSRKLRIYQMHNVIIKWKYFPRYWPFVRGIRRSPLNSPHKDQWRGALVFSLIRAWTNGLVNNGDVGDLKHHRAHYDIIVMVFSFPLWIFGDNPWLIKCHLIAVGPLPQQHTLSYMYYTSNFIWTRFCCAVVFI